MAALHSEGCLLKTAKLASIRLEAHHGAHQASDLQTWDSPAGLLAACDTQGARLTPSRMLRAHVRYSVVAHMRCTSLVTWPFKVQPLGT